jgi:hypothetical protein
MTADTMHLPDADQPVYTPVYGRMQGAWVGLTEDKHRPTSLGAATVCGGPQYPNIPVHANATHQYPNICACSRGVLRRGGLTPQMPPPPVRAVCAGTSRIALPTGTAGTWKAHARGRQVTGGAGEVQHRDASALGACVACRGEVGGTVVAGTAPGGGSAVWGRGCGEVPARDEVAQERQGAVHGRGIRVVAQELPNQAQEGCRAGNPPGQGPRESQAPLAPPRDAPCIGCRQGAS